MRRCGSCSAVILSDLGRATEAIQRTASVSPKTIPICPSRTTTSPCCTRPAATTTRPRARSSRRCASEPDYATAHENLGDVYAALAARAYATALRLESDRPASRESWLPCAAHSPRRPRPRARPRRKERISSHRFTSHLKPPCPSAPCSVRVLVALWSCCAPTAWAQKVKLETTAGNIVIALDAAKAPKTVDNFVQYVKAGHYDGTIFHRVIHNFMIQGGGMTADRREKPTRAPIALEAGNGP